MRKLTAIITASAVVVGLTVWGTVSSTTSKCTNVYVDYGVLDSGSTYTECVQIDTKTTALDVVRSAGLVLDGTDKYGSQIVCRINSLPSAVLPIGIKGHETYVERCTDMPAEFAYWAVLIKRASKPFESPLDLSVNWGWAQTGIADIELNPGDSIGFVFADNENVRFPN